MFNNFSTFTLEKGSMPEINRFYAFSILLVCKMMIKSEDYQLSFNEPPVKNILHYFLDQIFLTNTLIYFLTFNAKNIFINGM